MTIEQKAKAYDEALKAAVIAHKDEDRHLKAILERIFPQLIESEDERIRKWLIYYFKEVCDNVSEKEKKAILVWLEKQGTFGKKDVDDAYLKGVTDTKNEIEKQYEASYQIRRDIATFIFNYKGDIKDRAKWMKYLGVKVAIF